MSAAPAQPPDTEGVHAIANTEKPERIADVVFVHGLGGTSHGTWRYGREGNDGHFFWPEELAKERPDCGVWTVGYAAGMTEINHPGMLIEKRGGNIARQLVLSHLGTRPLIFITHSMGGLVVKSLIVASVLHADPSRKQLVANIRGIVFCGTPHKGSSLASAAGLLGRYFGGLGTACGGLAGWAIGDWIGRLIGTQPHVKEMEANAEPLDLLHDHFLEWHRTNPIAIESYAENQQLTRRIKILGSLQLGQVVARHSANTGIGLIHDVDADHLTLVKPPPAPHTINTMVFLGVNKFINDTLPPLANHAPPPAVSKSVIRAVWDWLEVFIPSQR